MHLTAIAIAIAVLTACGGNTPATSPRKLVLTGSSTVAPVVAELAKRYEAAHPGVRIEVQTGGSGRGIADAASGAADLGMASRALKADELQALTGHVIARDGVALLVHRDNPLAGLSREQVIGIYSGATTDWATLGGTQQAIAVVSKVSGRATLEVFLAHFGLKEEQVKAQVLVGENLEVVKTVSGNPQAIGYVSIGTAEQEIRAGSPIRLVALDGVMPSTAAVAAGRYPLFRPLILVSKGQPADLARDFLVFARSADGAALIAAQSFIPAAE